MEPLVLAVVVSLRARNDRLGTVIVRPLEAVDHRVRVMLAKQQGEHTR